MVKIKCLIWCRLRIAGRLLIRTMVPRYPGTNQHPRYPTTMTIHEISKAFQRSIDAMTDEKKKSVCEAIEANHRERTLANDHVFLASCGIRPDSFDLV